MFYERLKKLCAEKNTTVTTLLNNLNMSTGSTGRWKIGVLPNGETLIKISDYFNVSVDYLLEQTDKPEINK